MPRHLLPRLRRRAALAGLALSLVAAPAAAAPPEVVATGLQFAEGTIFVGDTLYLVDYGASDVLRLVGGRLERVWHGDGCGANGLLQVPQGLMVACFDSGTIETITLDGRPVSRLDRDDAGQRFQSPNDLVADRRGGVYFTASGSGGGAANGKVFHRDVAGHVREVAAGLAFANGLGLSPDGGELYITESTAGRLDAMPVAADGSLGPPRLVAALGDLLAKGAGKAATKGTPQAIAPDSLRVDRAGRLYVALYRGGGVAVVDPHGRLVQLIDVPGDHHTTLALSPDNRFVYVTAVDDTAAGTAGRLLRLPLTSAP